MIREFALEPEVVAQSYRDCRYFLEKFGVEYGRLISRFPKNWKRLAYEAAQKKHSGLVELSRIEASLSGMRADALLESRRPGGDVNQTWITRALIEHERLPFAGIIALDAPTSSRDVLLAGDLDENVERFHATGQRHIKRTSDDLVACIRPLLRCARTVKLIDPYFKPSEGRYDRPLNKLLRELNPGTIVEVHRADDGLPGNLQHWFRGIPQMLPKGIGLRVFLHDEKVMHNRFILTDLGGASFGTGLDDNEDNRTGSTNEDLVTLLSAAVRTAEWTRYASLNAFAEFKATA